jgi:hypothetical protein
MGFARALFLSSLWKAGSKSMGKAHADVRRVRPAKLTASLAELAPVGA